MTLTPEDRLDLHELMGRYGNAIDDRAWSRLGQIFTDDARFEIPHLNSITDGLPAIVAMMAESEMHPLAHLLMNVYADVEADGTVRLQSRAIFPIGDRPGVADRLMFGTYYDTVVKTDAGWRVKDRVFSLERIPDTTDQA